MKYLGKLKDFFSRTPALLAGVVVFAAMIGFAGVRIMQPGNANAASCTGTCVEITAEGMNPDTLAVKVGDFVQFNTADGQMHNISLGAGAGAHVEEDQEKGHHEGKETKGYVAHGAPHEHVGDYSSGDFGSGEAWKVQFKKAGTFRLHDHYNPNLEILVVVYEPGVTSQIQ